jgi:Tfp pilus assembly protein PilV
MQKVGYLIKKIKGFSLVEILLTVSIFTITVLTIVSFLSANDNSLRYATQYNEANYYLSQGLEAVKNIKDDDYSNLNNGTFGLMESANVWQLMGSSDNVNGYIRKIIITSPDASTKKATAEVSWVNVNKQTQTIYASLTFKDWNRIGYSPTPSPTPTPPPVTCTTNTAIDITCDNEFILYANGVELGQDTDWRTVHNYQVPLSSGKNVIAVEASGDFQTAQALLAQITHGTTKYYSDTDWKVTKDYFSGWNTINYDDSTWGNSTVYGNYGDSPWGTFGFPSPTSSKWIWTDAALIDSPVYFRVEFNGCPTTPSPTPTPTPVPVNWSNPVLVLDQDLTTSAAVVDMVKVGNYIYGVRSGTTNNFFIADVSNPASPTYSYLSIGYALTSVAVINNTAYVGSSDNSREVTLVNVTNRTSPALFSPSITFDLTQNDNVLSLLVDSSIDRMYVGRAAGPNRAELYIYNITNNTAPDLVTTYNMASSNAQFVNLYKNGNYLYATTSITSAEVHIVNLTNEASISGTSYNLTGNFSGRAITGYGNRLFVSNASSTMFALDITSPTSPSTLGAYSPGGVVNSIAVDQTKQLAFLGVTSTATATNEFQAVDISDPGSMSLYGSYNPANNNSYVRVIYDPVTDRNYIGTAITGSEFVVLRPGP